MKTTNHDQNRVQGDNLRHMQDIVSRNQLTPGATGILLLVADLMDEIAAGKERYMTIGATRNKSAFVLAVKGAGAPDPVYGLDVEELGMLAGELL